jgi:hypothetical protein
VPSRDVILQCSVTAKMVTPFSTHGRVAA